MMTYYETGVIDRSIVSFADANKKTPKFMYMTNSYDFMLTSSKDTMSSLAVLGHQ